MGVEEQMDQIAKENLEELVSKGMYGRIVPEILTDSLKATMENCEENSSPSDMKERRKIQSAKHETGSYMQCIAKDADPSYDFVSKEEKEREMEKVQKGNCTKIFSDDGKSPKAFYKEATNNQRKLSEKESMKQVFYNFGFGLVFCFLLHEMCIPI